MRNFKLFCLPYAGGSATVYSRWNKYLNSNIRLYPLELAGRGKRFDAPLYNNMFEAIDDIFKCVRDEIDGSSYAIFGHSMGSLLTYELVNKIRENKLRLPEHVFLSGRYPPHIKSKGKIMHLLPEDEFVEEIKMLGGTPNEIFQNKEILSIFTSILRADYKLLETYKFSGDISRVDCDITILNGKNDENVCDSDIEAWSNYTSKKCNVYEFYGGHFFINNNIEEVVDIINKSLK